MTPIFQSVLPDLKRGIAGDAFRVCVAAITDIPLPQVPSFSVGMMSAADPLMKDFLYTHGLRLEITDRHLSPPPQGWSILTGTLGALWKSLPHAVVALNGDIWHNPHPFELKLRDPEFFITLRPEGQAS